MSTPLFKNGRNENRNGRSQSKEWMRVVAVYMGNAPSQDAPQRAPPHTSTPSFSQGVTKTGVVYARWVLSVASILFSFGF